MNTKMLDIDWGYLLERLENLMDMGEEYLSRQLAEYEFDPNIFNDYLAFRWEREERYGFLSGVSFPDIPDHANLLGIDRTILRLRQNTLQFVEGHPANNVLLWGERGNGKSSAVKGLLKEFGEQGLRLIDVQKEDLFQLPEITDSLREIAFRFILFCDDLSFDESEVSYRELKALLEGGIQARPENILVYATSNRRHLMPERFQENTDKGEIHPEEAVSEKLSLSDRFGITLGFYPMGEETFLAIVRHLAKLRDLSISLEELEAKSRQWAMERGARSGRVARQFIDDLTGQLAIQAKTQKAPKNMG